MSTQSPSPALFFDTINGYQRTEALRTAIELDLFTHVAAGKRTAAQLAEACQASERGVRILADFLAICGFLRKNAAEGERRQKVCIPNRATKSLERKREQKKRVGSTTARSGAPDVRAASAARNGLDRCRYKGEVVMHFQVGPGVTPTLVNIGRAMEKQTAPLAVAMPSTLSSSALEIRPASDVTVEG